MSLAACVPASALDVGVSAGGAEVGVSATESGVSAGVSTEPSAPAGAAPDTGGASIDASAGQSGASVGASVGGSEAVSAGTPSDSGSDAPSATSGGTTESAPQDTGDRNESASQATETATEQQPVSAEPEPEASTPRQPAAERAVAPAEEEPAPEPKPESKPTREPARAATEPDAEAAQARPAAQQDEAAQQASPAENPAPRKEAAPQVDPSLVTLEGEKRVTLIADLEERLERIIEIISAYAFEDEDLDEIIDSRKIVIVYLNELVDVVARQKIYRAIRTGTTGYEDLLAAIEASTELREVLDRYDVPYRDVIGIQVTPDGTTEILVSERARLIITAARMPIDLDQIVQAYFPVRPAPEATIFALAPEAGPIAALLQEAAAPLPVVRREALATPSVPEAEPDVWQMPDAAEVVLEEAFTVSELAIQPADACSVLQASSEFNPGLLGASAWQGEEVQTTTAIPGWDVNGVTLVALVQDDRATHDMVMGILGAQVPDMFMALPGRGTKPAAAPEALETHAELWDDLANASNPADLVLASHARVEIETSSFLETEQVVTAFEPEGLRAPSFDVAALMLEPASPGCDPQTGGTLADLGLDDLRRQAWSAMY